VGFFLTKVSLEYKVNTSMRILSILLTVLLISCSTQPAPKTVVLKVKEPDNRQLRFYKAPEEIWPDDFPPAPRVCGSPFTGKLIAR